VPGTIILGLDAGLSIRAWRIGRIMRRMKRHVTLPLSVGAIGMLLAWALVTPAAQTTRRPATPPEVDAKAVAVLQAVDDAFAKAEGLVATYRSEIFRPNGGTGSVETVAIRLGRPNMYRLETSSSGTTRQVLASDGTTRFTVSPGSPGRCTTTPVSPLNDSREVDTFNPVYWSFYDLGQWQIRSALAGHWVTKWRLADPGLRSVRYVGSERAPDGTALDIVEWTYTIGYNRPGDDPLYTSRLWIGPDHFARRIETTSTSKNDYEGRRIVETMSDIRTTTREAKETFAYRPPEGVTCRAVNPEESYTTGAFADLPIGSKAPDFTLKTARGESLRLYTYLSQHKVVLMNYWGYG